MTDIEMTHEQFAPHVGSDFLLAGAEPPFVLKLTEATMLRRFDQERRAPFSLLFTTRDERRLHQMTHGLHHAEMGELDIFLVPIARDDAGITYEAVFN